VRRLYRLRPAVPDQGPVAVAELVSLGVPAEVVVIVEDQDVRAGADCLPEEIRRGETAHPAADDDEIVALSSVLGVNPRLRVSQRVSDLERPRVAAAHPGPRRRVVVGRQAESTLLSLTCATVKRRRRQGAP